MAFGSSFLRCVQPALIPAGIPNARMAAERDFQSPLGRQCHGSSSRAGCQAVRDLSGKPASLPFMEARAFAKTAARFRVSHYSIPEPSSCLKVGELPADQVALGLHFRELQPLRGHQQ